MTITEFPESLGIENLTVPGDLDSLSAIAQFVMSATTAAGIDKKAAYRFRLAVDEIATNIIIHGYEENGCEGELDLQVEFNEKSLTLTIEDTAISYDPKEHLLPEEEAFKQPLEQRKVGGLGVYLAIQGVDKFLYERVGKRNRNIFTVNRPIS